MSLKILTANRLMDGYSVRYYADGSWSGKFDNAIVTDSPLACALFEQAAKQAIADNEIVDAALIDVERHDGGLVALRLCERIRANGSTVPCVQNQNV